MKSDCRKCSCYIYNAEEDLRADLGDDGFEALDQECTQELPMWTGKCQFFQPVDGKNS